ncbi:hypothetical protein RCL1_004314 [Eukaryota sp. TZLM3-RCL]
MRALLLFLLFSVFFSASLAAIIGVDLGDASLVSHYLKKGSRPDIVLSYSGRRRFATMVAFENGERFIADAALPVSVRCPECASPPLFPLLIERCNGNTSASIWNSPIGDIQAEVLLAMILDHIATSAAEQSGELVKDIVLSVPLPLTPSLSSLLQRTISLANLTSLGIISSPAAAALELRIRHSFEEPSVVIFLDVGAKRLVTSAVEFVPATVKSKKGRLASSLGSISVVNQATEMIGGDYVTNGLISTFFDKLGVDHFFDLPGNFDIEPKIFDKFLNKIKPSILKAKELLAAHSETRVSLDKEMVLSIIPPKFHQIMNQNSKPGSDFSVTITSEELVSNFPDLIELTTRAVKNVISSFNQSEITGIVPIGGGTRSPLLLDAISSTFNLTILRMSNMDEGIAIGSVYYAASIHPGFAMVKFSLADYWKDDVISFPPSLSTYDSVIVNQGDRPAKFFANFRISTNFSVILASKFEYLAFIDVTSPQIYYDKELEIIKNLNSTVDIKQDPRPPKTRVNMHLSTNNHVEISSIWMTSHVNITTKIFKPKIEINSNNTDFNSTLGEDNQNFNQTVNQNFNQTVNQTVANEPDFELVVKKHVIKAQIPFKIVTLLNIVNNNISPSEFLVNISERIQSFVDENHQSNYYPISFLDSSINNITFNKLIPPISVGEELISQRKFLSSLIDLDLLREKVSESRHLFESFLYELKSNLYDEESLFVKCNTPENIENFIKILETDTEWLEFDSPLQSDDPTESVKIFNQRLENLHKIFDDSLNRIEEHVKRPESIKSLETSLDAVLKNFNQLNETLIRKKDKKEVLNKVKDIQKWLDKMVEKQSKRTCLEHPVVTVNQIVSKEAELRQLVKKILSKPPPEKAQSKNTTESTENDSSAPTDEL